MKKFHINEENATLGNVNGMGKISLPNVGEIGSGDIIVKKKSKKLKKFNDIYDELVIEKEVFFNISMIGDTAGLINVIENGLRKKFNITGNISNDLLLMNISYNAKVEIKSILPLSKTLGISQNNLKKEIEILIDDNISFLNESIEKTIEGLLTGEISLNESLLGRALGAIGGFALGPKIGAIIARVLGISEKGPLYNVLTSRVVSAALAQELTKNVF